MESLSPLLIVGLGNPGSAYAKSRHNLGFMVVEALASRHAIELREQPKFMGRIGRGRIEQREIYLLLPLTYMNESGRSVREVVSYYKFEPKQVLVVCDEADLPFGEMRFRLEGGTGGHRGLRSIGIHLGSQQYSRLRVGIGRDAGDLAEFVLARFTSGEEETLDGVIDRAVKRIEAEVREERPAESKE